MSGNGAVPLTAACTTRAQVAPAPQPAASPPQPPNSANIPTSGVAWNVMVWPSATRVLHIVPQSIPPGMDVTVPPLSPFLPTVIVNACTHAAERSSPASDDQRQPPGHRVGSSGYWQNLCPCRSGVHTPPALRLHCVEDTHSLKSFVIPHPIRIDARPIRPIDRRRVDMLVIFADLAPLSARSVRRFLTTRGGDHIAWIAFADPASDDYQDRTLPIPLTMPLPTDAMPWPMPLATSPTPWTMPPATSPTPWTMPLPTSTMPWPTPPPTSPPPRTTPP